MITKTLLWLLKAELFATTSFLATFVERGDHLHAALALVVMALLALAQWDLRRKP